MEWKFRSDLPIYSQLVEQIKLGIVSGSLLPGERLMSVRDMATEAGVNPNTMKKLAEEQIRGFQEAMKKLGYRREEILTLLKEKEEENGDS